MLIILILALLGVTLLSWFVTRKDGRPKHVALGVGRRTEVVLQLRGCRAFALNLSLDRGANWYEANGTFGTVRLQLRRADPLHLYTSGAGKMDVRFSDRVEEV